MNAIQHHQDDKIRCRALEALGGRDHFKPAALAVIMQAVADPSPEVRAQAVRMLGRGGDPALPLIIKALQDKQAEVRMEAVFALGRIGSLAAMSAAAAVLNDNDAMVRMAAGGTFERFRPHMSVVVNDLQNTDWRQRRQAVDKLGLLLGEDPMDPKVAPWPSLMQALQDPNPNVCASAAAALLKNTDFPHPSRSIAKIFTPALPKLLDALKNGDERTRLDTILVLSKLGPLAATAAPALRGALADENWLIRYQAAVALIHINPKKIKPLQNSIVPVLSQILSDPRRAELLGIDDHRYPHLELTALAEIGSPDAVATLINLLQISDRRLRYTLFRDNDPDIQAADALLKINPRPISPLGSALRNDHIRFLAAYTLGHLGPQAVAFLRPILLPMDAADPALKAILREKDADIRRGAVYALWQLGRDNPDQKQDIMNILTAKMNDQSEPLGLRQLAAAALLKMRKNVDVFFLDHNLPKPVDESCVLKDIAVGLSRCNFDMYAGRCLFSEPSGEGGGFEIFQNVRDMLIKQSSAGSTTPPTQPAATGR